jgi:type I restriction enzyme R subunit
MIEISAMVDAIDGEIVAAQTSLARFIAQRPPSCPTFSPVACREGPMSEYRLAEKPALDALVAMGWQALSPAAALAMRVEENRVILKPVLIAALRDLNSIGEADAEAIYADLATLSDNEDWQRKLRGGYSRRLTGENRDSPITLIDFKNPARNQFHVTRQFRVAAQRPRIPDVVLFVNGIPLVVIEAKSPLKATARAEEAFEQIKQYERDIPRLFAPNAFNIVTDGMATLYGATGSPAQFYAPWPDAWPRTRADFPDDLSKDLWCLCEPSRLLDLLAHFIVFEVDPETGRKIKKVCRYQQFRAVNKAVERVAAGEHRKGLIWHTQGSGKSLTMVFLALKLKTHLTLDAPSLANPNILVLTDRIDLDDQISKTFVACGLPNPTQCGSVAALREAVNRGGNGQILLSTIFKFAGSKRPSPTRPTGLCWWMSATARKKGLGRVPASDAARCPLLRLHRHADQVHRQGHIRKVQHRRGRLSRQVWYRRRGARRGDGADPLRGPESRLVDQ